MSRIRGRRGRLSISWVSCLTLMTLVLSLPSALVDPASGLAAPSAPPVPAPSPVSSAARDAHGRDLAAVQAIDAAGQSSAAIDRSAGPSAAVVDDRVAAFGAPAPPKGAATIESTPAQDQPPAVTPLETHNSGHGRMNDAEQVEVIADRDRYRRVLADPSGRLKVEMSSIPIHYQDQTGVWRPVDNRVVRDSSGVLVNSANDWQVRFLPMTAGGVEFRAADGRVSFAARGAANVAPAVQPDGVSVRYGDVFPGTDLVYQVTGAGVEELLVLKAPSARAQVDFEFAGATFTREPAGLRAAGESGMAKRLTLSAPETFDGKGKPVDADRHVFGSSELSTAAGKRSSIVSVGVDGGWLKSQPESQFPIVVDPSVTVTRGANWVHSYANHSNGNSYGFFDDGYARVGNPYLSSTSTVRWRSVANFSYEDYLWANVESGHLTTNVVNGGNNGSQSFSVMWAAQDGFHAGVWPHYYVGSPPWRGAAVASGMSPVINSTLADGAANHVGYISDLYNGWSRDGRPGGGLLFMGNEGASYTSKKFSVTLTLVVNRWPSGPSGAIGSTPNPTNRWLHFGVQTPGSDPDGDTVVYNHWVAGPSGLLFQTGWTNGLVADYQVPISTYGQSLSYGTDYWDGRCTQGECHTGHAFTRSWTPVDVAPPEARAGATPDGVNTANTTPTLSVNPVSDANTDPVHYYFQACPPSLTNCANSGWITSTSWTVPANTLYWGEVNYWWVWTNDGYLQTDPTVNHWVIPAVTPANNASLGTGWNPFSTDAHGVDPANGNFRHSMSDLTLPVVGTDLSVTRTYNSQNIAVSSFGKGWTFPLDVSVSASALGAMVTAPDGSQQFFGQNPNGTFGKVPGSSNTLVKNPVAGVTWRLTDTSKTYYDFDASGRLLAAVDLNGRRITSSWPNATTQLFRDVDSGRALTLTYATPTGATKPHIASVSTAAVAAHGGPLVWTYHYTGDRLDQACDPTANVATGTCLRYTYDTSARLVKIVLPRGNTGSELGYDGQGRVAWHQNGLGQRTTFGYSTVTLTPPSGGSVTLNRVSITDPRGNTLAYDSDPQRRVRHRDDMAGGQRWYEFDVTGYVSAVTDELGQTERLRNDSRGNVLDRADPAGKVWTSGYDANDQPSWAQTPLGTSTRTVYVHDATTGNRLSETDPLGNRQSWAYTTGSEPAVGGGTVPKGLLRTSTDQRGNVTAHDYNSAGDLVRTTDPAGMRVEHTYDELGRVLTDTQTWSATTSVSTYTYDALSRVVTTTQPSVGNAVAGTTHQARATSTYDRNGNLLETRLVDTAGGDPDRVTRHDYDNNDREWRVTDPEGGVVSRQLDQNGNVTQTTDQLSRVTRIDVDRSNRPTKVTRLGVTDPTNPGAPARDVVLSQASYDRLDRIATETDAVGTVTRYAYDSRGGLTSRTVAGYLPRSGPAYDVVVQGAGYDDAHRVAWAEAGGQRVTYTYDNAGRRTGERHHEGVYFGVTYPDKLATSTLDARGNAVRTVISDGTTTGETRTAFDAMDRPVSITVENGTADPVTVITRDQAGHVTGSTDPRGFTTTNDYDALGRPYRTLAPEATVERFGQGPVSGRATALVGYDTFGSITHRRDTAGAVTASGYDRLGRQTTITHPTYDAPGATPATTPTERFTFDAVGNIVSHVDRRGQTTDVGYDSLNRAVSQTDPPATSGAQRGQTLRRFDDASRLVWQQNQIGAVTEASYDMLGRARTSTTVVRRDGGADRFTTTYGYNVAGQPTYLETPTGDVTTSVYTNTGRLLRTTDPLGKVTTFAHDVAGRVTRVTDPLGRSTRASYDSAGRLIESGRYSAAGARLGWQNYAYDPAGNRTSVTEASGTRTDYANDALNRLTRVTQPVGGGQPDIVTSYGYDERGLRTRVTDGRSSDWFTTYNTWGLVESQIEPATPADPALAARTFTTSYDPAGSATVEEQPGGARITRGYDNLGRLTAEDGGTLGGQRGFGYDLAGRTATATTADTSVQLSYDDRGLLATASGSPGSSSFGYDASGRMISRIDPAGMATYSWTARNELFGLSDTLTGQSRTYSRSDAGDLLSINYGGMTVRDYTYDPIGRLDTDRVHNWVGEVWNDDYGYDINGNLTTEAVGPADVAGAGTHAYTYDAADRLTGWTGPGAQPGGTAYDYDATGNRITAGNTTYTYDARNRMLTEGATTYAWTPRGDMAAKTTGGTTTAFSYDGLGQLTAAGNIGYRYDAYGRVIVRGANAFAYSGLDPHTVLDGTSYVVHSPTGDPVATGDWVVGGRHVIADRHGDAVAAVKPDGGLLGSVAYDPAGVVTAQTGTNTSTVGYQGAYTDPATGLVDMGARWYQPGSASFTSRDTHAGQPTDPATLNRYGYANDNPLSHTDPDGRQAKRIGNSGGKTTKNTASTKKASPATKSTSSKRTAAPVQQATPKQFASQPKNSSTKHYAAPTTPVGKGDFALLGVGSKAGTSAAVKEFGAPAFAIRAADPKTIGHLPGPKTPKYDSTATRAVALVRSGSEQVDGKSPLDLAIEYQGVVGAGPDSYGHISLNSPLMGFITKQLQEHADNDGWVPAGSYPCREVEDYGVLGRCKISKFQATYSNSTLNLTTKGSVATGSEWWSRSSFNSVVDPMLEGVEYDGLVVTVIGLNGDPTFNGGRARSLLDEGVIGAGAAALCSPLGPVATIGCGGATSMISAYLGRTDRTVHWNAWLLVTPIQYDGELVTNPILVNAPIGMEMGDDEFAEVIASADSDGMAQVAPRRGDTLIVMDSGWTTLCPAVFISVDSPPSTDPTGAVVGGDNC